MMGWMRQYGYISADLFWLNPSDNDADWQCTLNRHDYSLAAAAAAAADVMMLIRR